MFKKIGKYYQKPDITKKPFKLRKTIIFLIFLLCVALFFLSFLTQGIYYLYLYSKVYSDPIKTTAIVENIDSGHACHGRGALVAEVFRIGSCINLTIQYRTIDNQTVLYTFYRISKDKSLWVGKTIFITYSRSNPTLVTMGENEHRTINYIMSLALIVLGGAPVSWVFVKIYYLLRFHRI